jgi:hypothetical protein
MSFDDLLIAIIIAGTGLSGAYLGAKYVSWRRYKAAERRREFSLRELYANHLCDENNDASAPSVIYEEKSLDAKFTGIAAITDGSSFYPFTYEPHNEGNIQ